MNPSTALVWDEVILLTRNSVMKSRQRVLNAKQLDGHVQALQKVAFFSAIELPQISPKRLLQMPQPRVLVNQTLRTLQNPRSGNAPYLPQPEIEPPRFSCASTSSILLAEERLCR
jgi:hypothetical protein